MLHTKSCRKCTVMCIGKYIYGLNHMTEKDCEEIANDCEDYNPSTIVQFADKFIQEKSNYQGIVAR